jgi:hypothetical protein
MMVGEQLLDWLFGHEEKKDTVGDLKARIKELKPIRKTIFSDISRGFLFGFLKQKHMLFKHGDVWGTWPPTEVLEYEALALAMLWGDKIEKLEKDKPNNSMPEVPEALKKKSMLREKEWFQQRAKKQLMGGS